MAEYNERTGRFIWMRLLPITQREAVEGWVRSQFASPQLSPAKRAPSSGTAQSSSTAQKVRSPKAG
jgi:hypothetical protein